MRTLRRLLTAALAPVFLAAAAARGQDAPPAESVVLEFRVVTTREDAPGARRRTPRAPRSETTVRATLGPRRVEVAEEGRRVVLDFARERMLRVAADGSHRDVSLLASVGFVDAEMRNRARLGRALAGTSAAEPSFAPREVSVLFGRIAEGDTSAVVAAEDGEAVVFREGDEELARWTPSAETLDPAQAASLSRFLIHRGHLHPQVRDAVVAKARVPAALRYRWLDVGARSTAAWTLVRVTRTTDAPAALGRRTFDVADDVERLAARVLAPPADAAKPWTRDVFVERAREARAAGRYEDAVLLLLECGLQTGDAVTDELRALREDHAAAARADAFVRAISTGGREPAAALDALAAVDRTELTRPEVLDVFAANVLLAAERPDDARETMLGALETLPFLTGAWKDLGGMCHGAYECERAWLAWEAGRAVAPEHPMWASVAQFEERLRKAYPERL